jgi:beta-glucosidase
MRTIACLLMLLFFSVRPGFTQGTEPDFQRRAAELVARMTLEEKVGQLRYEAPAIPRLGIPEYNWWNECLHGVGRAGIATVFPQAIGMAATFNDRLMFDVATAISDEARAKHHHFASQGRRDIYQGLTFWTPNINIFRDPRWGRGQETYGEDPYLTSRMAVQFIRGLQGDDPAYLKLVATAKHFAVHSGPESIRHSFDARVSSRDLYDTYLPAFEAAVREAGVASVMCAYNRFRGEACCGSDALLQGILRDDWGFKGYVVSDCWAIADFYEAGRHGLTETASEAAALALRSGTDLNCGNTFPHLLEAVSKGEIEESLIDRAAVRLFEYRFRLGMFDEPNSTPWGNISYAAVAGEEHRALALRTARESMVLLKNENNTLPFRRDIGSIAVIGPNADEEQVLLGNYHGTSDSLRTPLSAMLSRVRPGATVRYAEGCELAEGVRSMAVIPHTRLFPDHRAGTGHGLMGEYFDNPALEGAPVLTRLDPVVDFMWAGREPLPGHAAGAFSVRWTGYLQADETGLYRLGIQACNTGRLWLDDSLLVQFNNPHHPTRHSADIPLEKGRYYRIRAEMVSNGADPQARLIWSGPERDLLEEAVRAARNSEAVVLVLGLSPHLEGEEMPVRVKGFSGGDRTEIELPETQQVLIERIMALGKPCVLVLMGGSALAFPQAAQHVPAILYAWYPGEAGGEAIADVLFGDYNPAGRLPVTFYKGTADLPAFEDYAMAGRTYRYFDGEALYPFGYGLSYTAFRYEKLRLSRKTIDAAAPLVAEVTVHNAGNRDGDEVVQVYIRDLDSDLVRPVHSLRHFGRLHLKAGESVRLRIELGTEDFSIVDEEGRRIVEPGIFRVSVGGGQPGMPGSSGTVQSADVHYHANEPLILP